MIVTVFCVEHVAVVLEDNRKRPDARYLGTRELLASIGARLIWTIQTKVSGIIRYTVKVN